MRGQRVQRQCAAREREGDARDEEEQSAGRSASPTDPPMSDPMTSGTSWAMLIAPTWNDECVSCVDLEGDRDDGELGPERRDQLADEEEPEVTALAQRRRVDEDPPGHRRSLRGARRRVGATVRVQLSPGRRRDRDAGTGRRTAARPCPRASRRRGHPAAPPGRTGSRRPRSGCPGPRRRPSGRRCGPWPSPRRWGSGRSAWSGARTRSAAGRRRSGPGAMCSRSATLAARFSSGSSTAEPVPNSITQR